MVVVRVLAQAGDQQARGLLGDVLRGLFGGGQRRPGLLGKRAVLETGDGQVVGHVHAGGLGRRQHAGRDLVVGAEDRGGRFAQRQQSARATEAVVVGVIARHDEMLVERDAVVLQRLLIAGIAFGARPVRQPAPQEADALVAELDQVLGDLVGGIAVVDINTGQAVFRIFRRRDDAHQLHPARGQRIHQVGALGHRRGQHQAGQARALHEFHQLLRQQRRGGIHRMDLQAEAGFLARRQHAVLHADDVVRVGVVVHQSDDERRAAAQVARGLVRFVVQFGDGVQHARARALQHRRFVVDDPGHGLQRDLRAFGDVLDGGSAHGRFRHGGESAMMPRSGTAVAGRGRPARCPAAAL